MAERKLPDDLIQAFIKLKKSGWTDKAYNAYVKVRKKYLKGKDEDKIEQGRLVVDLSRATMHLFKADENVTNTKKKAKKKARRKKPS